MDHNVVERAVRYWVETVVIELNLCPFAQKVMIKDSVRFSVAKADPEEQLLIALHCELELLLEDEAIETTLLIHPYILQDFYTYYQFLLHADSLLQQMELEGVFQIASFHPNCQFADTTPEDVENYTNRSPFPILHILREASLDIAIDSHPDTSMIPSRHRQLMREMGSERLRKIIRDY